MFYKPNIYIFSMYLFFETGENNRFRYEMDPVVWAIAVGFIGAGLAKKGALSTLGQEHLDKAQFSGEQISNLAENVP